MVCYQNQLLVKGEFSFSSFCRNIYIVMWEIRQRYKQSQFCLKPVRTVRTVNLKTTHLFIKLIRIHPGGVKVCGWDTWTDNWSWSGVEHSAAVWSLMICMFRTMDGMQTSRSLSWDFIERLHLKTLETFIIKQVVWTINQRWT